MVWIIPHIVEFFYFEWTWLFLNLASYWNENGINIWNGVVSEEAWGRGAGEMEWKRSFITGINIWNGVVREGIYLFNHQLFIDVQHVNISHFYFNVWTFVVKRLSGKWICEKNPIWKETVIDCDKNICYLDSGAIQIPKKKIYWKERCCEL